MAKGSDQPTPTQTTQQVLSPEQRQILDLAMPGIKQFAANVPQRYQGSSVAGFDPSQVAGQELALGAAGSVGNLARSGADSSNYWMSPEALDVNNNPAIRGAIDAAVRPVYQNLTESALPAIRSGSVGNGTYGGSRQGIAEGLAIRGANQTAADTASKIASDAYSTNAANQLRALGLLPQTQQAQLGEATTVSGVGDVRQGQTQAQLSDRIAGFNYDQLAPFLQSKELVSLLQGLPGGSTVATGSVPPQPSGLQQALGGAATGASLGSMFGPIGTGVGAVGGAVLPFLF